MGTLLPANATALERAAAAAGRFDIPVALADLYNPATCPAAVLPWLAWAWHMTDAEGWALAATVEQQRNLLAESAELHRRKGTRWAVLTALARAGYPDCDIVEHRSLIARWLQAGGELLDGAGNLDGNGTLAPPAGGDYRFMTTNWAENIVRVNFTEADWSADAQRRIIAVAQEWAPLRSAFVALVATAVWTWASPVTFAGTQRLTTVMSGCRRHPVARFDTLDGCDLLGGENIAECIDGIGALDGTGMLSGTSPTGEPLDGGNLGYGATLRHVSGFAAGGDVIERETLGSDECLDGSGTIAGELLDGFGAINAGNLWCATLCTPDNTLDGTSNLGRVVGPDTTWFRGTIAVTRGTTRTMEAL